MGNRNKISKEKKVIYMGKTIDLEKVEDGLIKELNDLSILDGATVYVKTVRLNDGARAEIHMSITRDTDNFLNE